MNIQRSIQLSDKSVRQYWLRGLLRAVIEGGATAITTSSVMAGANGLGVPVPILTLNQMAAVFIGQGLYKAMFYLKDHPLPEQDDIPENVEQAMAEKQEPKP